MLGIVLMDLVRVRIVDRWQILSLHSITHGLLHSIGLGLLHSIGLGRHSLWHSIGLGRHGLRHLVSLVNHWLSTDRCHHDMVWINRRVDITSRLVSTIDCQELARVVLSKVVHRGFGCNVSAVSWGEAESIVHAQVVLLFFGNHLLGDLVFGDRHSAKRAQEWSTGPFKVVDEVLVARHVELVRLVALKHNNLVTGTHLHIAEDALTSLGSGHPLVDGASEPVESLGGLHPQVRLSKLLICWSLSCDLFLS